MVVNGKLMLNRQELYMVRAALADYARRVNRYYSRKLATLARQISESGLALQPGTLRRALEVHEPRVSAYYSEKLGTLYRKLGEVG